MLQLYQRFFSGLLERRHRAIVGSVVSPGARNRPLPNSRNKSHQVLHFRIGAICRSASVTGRTCTGVQPLGQVRCVGRRSFSISRSMPCRMAGRSSSRGVVTEFDEDPIVAEVGSIQMHSCPGCANGGNVKLKCLCSAGNEVRARPRSVIFSRPPTRAADNPVMRF